MVFDCWVVFVLLGICMVYGYMVWFMMDVILLLIMKWLVVWLFFFLKVLLIVGIVLCFIVLSGIEKGEEKIGDIDYCRLYEYNLG